MFFRSFHGGRNYQVLVNALLCFLTHAGKEPSELLIQKVWGPQICISSQLPHDADAVGTPL